MPAGAGVLGPSMKSSMHETGCARDLRSFGRRRGRALSARQASLWRDLLPQVALTGNAAELASPHGLFAATVRERGGEQATMSLAELLERFGRLSADGES